MGLLVTGRQSFIGSEKTKIFPPEVILANGLMKEYDCAFDEREVVGPGADVRPLHCNLSSGVDEGEGR